MKKNDFEDKDEDIAMIAKKFRRFLKKLRERRKFKDSKNKKGNNETIIFFQCKKLDHIKLECHVLNNPK